MEVDGSALGDRMVMHQRMQHARSCVDGHKAGPILLLFSWEGVVCSSLMNKASITSILWHADNVVADVGEDTNFERAIIVPLRAHSIDAHVWIVAEAEDVGIGCLRMYAMGAVHLTPTPKLACSALLVAGEHTLIFEDQKSTRSHFRLQGLKNNCWWLGSTKVQPKHLCTQWMDGFEDYTMLLQEGDTLGGQARDPWPHGCSQIKRFCAVCMACHAEACHARACSTDTPQLPPLGGDDSTNHKQRNWRPRCGSERLPWSPEGMLMNWRLAPP
mmetsp:Transcript_70733/g.179029  ORF Transcript_70733/g.179029 Transcript_70733/m.179029 type:complete len:272 (+) Transcript_70733:404-1219(+)